MKELIELLIEKQLSLSIAESCTGGLLSYYFTKNPGASQYYKGSIIAYSNSVKKNILGVSGKILAYNQTVSEECAVEMVLGLRRLIRSNIYISVTGNAGPTANCPELKGIIYYSILYRDNLITSTIKCTNLNRESTQHIITKTIIKKLFSILTNNY